MKNKIVISVFCIILFALIGVLSFIASRKTAEEATPLLPTVDTQNIQPLKTGTFLTNQPEAKFFYTGNPITFPQSLPVYAFTFDDMAIQANISTFVQLASYNSPPETVGPGNLFYRGDKDLLKINLANRYIAFNSTDYDKVEKSRFKTSDEVLSFFSQAKLLSPLIKTTQISVQKKPVVGEEGDRSPEESTTETAYLLDNGFRLFFTAFSLSSAQISSIPSFGVTSFTIHIPPSTLLKKESRSLMTIDQLVQALNEGKGELITISDSGDFINFNPAPSYTRVIIKNIDIVYLPVEKDGLYVPVFHIIAKGEGGQGQDLEFFIRATE